MWNAMSQPVASKRGHMWNNFKTNIASSRGENPSEFSHRNLVDLPKFTNSFIEKFASDNLPIKATLTRGYKFFHELYFHNVEGMLELACLIWFSLCRPNVSGCSPKKTSFQFFLAVKLAKNDEGITSRAKCFRTMKKKRSSQAWHCVQTWNVSQY